MQHIGQITHTQITASLSNNTVIDSSTEEALDYAGKTYTEYFEYSYK